MLNRIGKWFSLSTEETLPSKVYTSFVGLSLKENKLMQNELYAIKSVTLAIQIRRRHLGLFTLYRTFLRLENHTGLASCLHLKAEKLVP